MLKLVIPLASRADVEVDANEDGRRDLEPLALLVHPQQPLSYLERLIQSELPPLKDKDGHEKIPSVNFRAPDASTEEDGEGEGESEKESGKSEKGSSKAEKESNELDGLEGSDVTIIDGKRVKTGKLKNSDEPSGSTSTNGDKKGHKHLENSKSFSLPDPETNPASSDPDTFVRWSASTEIGDFIRDAARAKHFALDIEGTPAPILVGVPSFQDRTYYLRMRLRQKSREIERYADIKRECDEIAERSAKTVAFAGGAALVVYWFVVYMGTFRTSLGWDVMEPVTVSLSTTTYKPIRLTRVVSCWIIVAYCRLCMVLDTQPTGLVSKRHELYHKSTTI
jgi:calcium uniporter protein, mitochondrial